MKKVEKRIFPITKTNKKTTTTFSKSGDALMPRDTGHLGWSSKNNT